MSHTERMGLIDGATAGLIARPSLLEILALTGVYHIECFDPDGNLKWADTAENTVVNVGKNLVLDTFLGGTTYTAVGPYMGLIATLTSVAAGDTMASHAGWTEFTNIAARGTPAWSAASGGSKSTSSAVSFSINAGTNVACNGCFLVLGTSAVSTVGSTAGTLYSAGAFTGGAKTVSSGDTLNVSYTGSA